MIVHGTKLRERKLGWVAEFCPICRTVRACQLIRVGLVSHIYFVGFGDGKLVGFQVECSECKTRIGTQETRHHSIERKNLGDLATLVAATFPNLPEILGERLATEKQLREDPSTITAELRRKLIAEPFSILNPEVESRQQQTQFDKPAAFGCLGTAVVTAAGIFGFTYVPKRWDDLAGYALLSLVGIGIIYTIVQLALVNRRHYRELTLPRLVRALQPIKPNAGELEAAILHCREMGMKIGKQVRVQDVVRELESRHSGLAA